MLVDELARNGCVEDFLEPRTVANALQMGLLDGKVQLNVDG